MTQTAWSCARRWSTATRWRPTSERFGGPRVSSDRLADLDAWGLETTRRLLAHSPAAPFIAS